MTNAQILAFSGASLTLALGLFALLFPHASMTEEQRVRLDAPQDARTLGQVDLGGYFGKVPVSDLVDYYVTNPPNAAASVEIKVDRFGGC